MNTTVAVPYRPVFVLPFLFSWDDSSSVSSGLSDTLDNISTDDLNTPVYSAGGSSRKSRGGGAQVRLQIAFYVILDHQSWCKTRSGCFVAFADANGSRISRTGRSEPQRRLAVFSVCPKTASERQNVETQHKLLISSLMLHQKSEDGNVLLI